MLTYQPSERAEFTALIDQDGVVYHQRGSYTISTDQDVLIPINRSYRPLYPTDILPTNPQVPYIQDRVIHDTVPEKLNVINHEKKVSIFGKTLLFVADKVGQSFSEYSPKLDENPLQSEQAKGVLELLIEGLSKLEYDIQLGVFGSHEVGLNGVESDLDLVAWVPRLERPETLNAIGSLLINSGYINANDTGKFDEYTARIANLTGLPPKAAAYLAGQRNRWLSPASIYTSLQCIHSDYDHKPAETLINRDGNQTYEVNEKITNMPVEIVGNCEPYNYPRTWTIFYNGSEYPLISFNMVHQGMGTDGQSANNHDGLYTLSAVKVQTDQGRELFVMKDDTDYLLPASIVA